MIQSMFSAGSGKSRGIRKPDCWMLLIQSAAMTAVAYPVPFSPRSAYDECLPVSSCNKLTPVLLLLLLLHRLTYMNAAII